MEIKFTRRVKSANQSSAQHESACYFCSNIYQLGIWVGSDVAWRWEKCKKHAHVKLIYNSRNLITRALQGKQIKRYKTKAFWLLQLFYDP